ncbi:MAG: TlpA family protein disulfide reductase [Armatimonadetes bacterium]|nr:TlpA family protein disulfide reductase [Armatimonadota bacterium]
MDEQDELGVPHEAPEPQALPAVPVAPRRRRRGWRVVVVLASLAIIALVLLGGLAVSVRANPRGVVDRLLGGKPPTSMAMAGSYMLEIGMGGFSTKLENRFAVEAKKPNLLRVEHGTKEKQHFVAVSDGKDIYLDAGDGKSVAKAPAPADFEKLMDDPELKKQVAEMAKSTGIDPSKPESMAKQITRCYVGVARGSAWMRTLRRPGLTVPVTAEMKNGLGFTAWVDLRTRLPRQLAYDISGKQLARVMAESPMAKQDKATLADMAKGLEGMQLKVLISFTSCRQNVAIAADRFRYQPPQQAKVNTAKKWTDLPSALLGLPPEGFKAPEEKSLVGEKAPDFTAATLDGDPVSLKSMRGKPVVLDFWATWCPPCRKSMPVLDEVYRANRDKGLKVVGVSTDRTSDLVRKHLADNPVGFRILWLDPTSEGGKATDKAYGITAIPRTLFIDRDGVVQADTTGLHDAEEMKESLAKIGIK